MILVLFGPPGAGKGTQGARISLHYGIPSISTGAMFRDALAKNSELGRQIARYRIERGEFVPDEVVTESVCRRIGEEDCRKGFVLDGYPRTIPQANSLGEMLSEAGKTLSAVLDFEAPIEDIVRRFSGRRVCPKDGSTYHLQTQPPLQPGICDICHTTLVTRPDDEPDVVRRRLEIYSEKTAPLIEYYLERGLLYTMDASEDPETIFSRVISLIGKLKK